MATEKEKIGPVVPPSGPVIGPPETPPDYIKDSGSDNRTYGLGPEGPFVPISPPKQIWNMPDQWKRIPIPPRAFIRWPGRFGAITSFGGGNSFISRIRSGVRLW